MDDRIKLGAEFGLGEKYIKDIYETVHTESLKIQTELMKNGKL